jgi:hypothetical protein
MTIRDRSSRKKRVELRVVNKAEGSRKLDATDNDTIAGEGSTVRVALMRAAEKLSYRYQFRQGSPTITVEVSRIW